jgi:ABC-2 type transport system ATP-binding protein
VLELQQVSKHFGDRRALDEVTMTLHPGQLTGFVGANGAGKTTTMRIIMGLLEPDSGELTWDGVPLDASRRREFGYMPEERGLYPHQGVREQLAYFGRLHGMSAGAARTRADVLLETFQLTDRAKDRIEQLSLGNQQRVQIAVALMHRPQALVLDEPFSGLDPAAVAAMGALITECATDGVPVLFSSHQLDLVERLCDDLIIIADGAIRANGTPESLRSDYSHSSYDILLEGDAGWLREVDGVTVTELDGAHAVFDAVDPVAAQHALARAVAVGGVKHFAPRTPSLAEIFKEIVR